MQTKYQTNLTKQIWHELMSNERALSFSKKIRFSINREISQMLCLSAFVSWFLLMFSVTHHLLRFRICKHRNLRASVACCIFFSALQLHRQLFFELLAWLKRCDYRVCCVLLAFDDKEGLLHVALPKLKTCCVFLLLWGICLTNHFRWIFRL